MSPRIRALLASACVALLLVPHSAVADTAGLPGPPARLEQVLPTVMEETATLPVDLDGDGADDLVVLGRDGVAQRYAPDGTPQWSTSYVEVADALGVVPFRQNAQFWADFRGLTSCGSDASVAFHDVNRDGTRDVFALLWFRTDVPADGVRTVVVSLDGATGVVLRATALAGRALAHAVGDLDGDGRAEHVVVEEDGPPVTWSRATEDERIEGSGASASVRATDAATGAARWTFDTGATWPVTSGLVLLPRGAGHDVVVSLGGSNESVRCTGSDTVAQSQRVVALAGTTGTLRWETPVDAVAQDLIALADGGLVTWTDDGGGVVEVLEGADGARRWRAAGVAGGGVLGAVAPAGAHLAVLSARPSDDDGNESRLHFLDVANGATVGDVRLDDSAVGEPSELPSGDELRLARTGAEGAGAPAVIARTPRTLSAVTAAGQLAWQEDSAGTVAHVLFVTRGPDGLRVWTQGALEASRFDVPGGVVSVGSRTDTGLYRLTGRSAGTGERTATIPLLANVLGATRADISGDGVPDRIFGGLGQVLSATDGVTGAVRWRTDLGREILDVWPEDLDGDGAADLLVEGDLAALGVRGHDGAVLWSFTLEFPLLDGYAAGAGGAWRDVEVADLSGDGVRDLVLGFRTARDEAWAPAGNAKVIVVDGRTGAEHWRAELPAFNKGVNALAVGDVTGDGVPDVAASVDGVADAIYYGVVLLDGDDGRVVWAEHEVTGGARDTWGRDSVELVDHGGDGDLDVAVLTRDFNTFRTELDARSEVRVHDGRSGAFLASAQVKPDVEQLWLTGMQTADFGHAGRLVVVYAAYSGQSLVRAYNPEDLSVRFSIEIPTGASIWDAAAGDLTGDDVADLALPTGAGLFVVDGAAALDGEVVILARTAPHHPLKGVLVEADGDGVAELETLETPAGWPLQIGPAFTNHTAGAVRSLGLLDLSP